MLVSKLSIGSITTIYVDQSPNSQKTTLMTVPLNRLEISKASKIICKATKALSKATNTDVKDIKSTGKATKAVGKGTKTSSMLGKTARMNKAT